MSIIISLIPIALLVNNPLPIVDGNYIVQTGGPIPVHSRRTETHAKCLSGQKVSIVYKSTWSPYKTSIADKNSWSGGPRGVVEKIAIDGKDVPGAAAALKARVIKRGIDWISISDCGSDNSDLTISGIMRLSGSQSKDNQNSTVYFQFNKNKMLKLN